MPRIANSQARQFVIDRAPFRGNNTHGRQLSDGSYAAFSYGAHWPLYIWWRQTRQWFGNIDRYSRTTSKHAGQLRPGGATIRHLRAAEMRALIDICESEARAALIAKLLAFASTGVQTADTPVVEQPIGKRRLLPLTG
jgi:hypothetical protein